MQRKHHRHHQRADLVRLANECMRSRGLEPEFPPSVARQLNALVGPGSDPAKADGAFERRDLRKLLWCSIDNDDSRDLDQLTACETLPDGAVKLYVAIADVDALIKKDSAIDRHAQTNTTSVYTSARIFPMLPEPVSTGLTSLNPQVDRMALVTEMLFDASAGLMHFEIGLALVHNHAQLAYDALSGWIEGKGELPAPARAVAGLDEQIRAQDRLAQALRIRRHDEGSLEFESFQPRAIFEGERVVAIAQQVQNRARQLIEEIMIATNACTATFLANHKGSSLRRVVRSPERWMRIVEVARDFGVALPAHPDGRALEAFLAARHKADPLRFPDLSLVIVKLMGRGEYVVETFGSEPLGHFGLAARNYTHSTAPNRRFPDLITLRMVKAILTAQPSPYSEAELSALALQCTRQEDAAQKVERQMRKSEAALLLEPRIGDHFEAIVTGSSSDGIWVRILVPPTEGRLMEDAPGIRIGDRMRVRLSFVDVEKGFIDFKFAAH